MNEKNSLKTLSRMAQTAFYGSSAALKFGTASLFGQDVDHDKQAAWLLATLGNLKGPVMKAAQFLATVPGALPKEYADAFVNLQSNAPSMGEGFVKRRMRGELGPDWQDQFLDFSLTPSFAASLGQVHKAQTAEGNHVACKLQYPDMKGIIDGDLAQLSLFLKGYNTLNGALNVEEIFEEIKEKLNEELDYIQEAKNQFFFSKIFENTPEIIVPKVIKNLSTNRLLTMEWVEGQSFFDKVNETLSVRNDLAQKLFHAWYKPLYHFGFLHGDPHPGNYQANKHGGINILDFGCVRVFEPTFIQGIMDLYRALQHNDGALLVHAYETWGFKNMNKAMIDAMSDWAKLLFDPLLDDRVRPIQEEITGWDVASKVHTEIGKLGGITPPRAFVFMDRAAVGIGSILFHLKAELNWHRLFENLIEDFSLTQVQKNQSILLDSLKTV